MEKLNKKRHPREVEDTRILDDSEITPEDLEAAGVTTHEQAMQDAVEFGEEIGDKMLVENAKEKIEQIKDVVEANNFSFDVYDLTEFINGLINKTTSLEESQQQIEAMLQKITEISERMENFDSTGEFTPMIKPESEPTQAQKSLQEIDNNLQQLEFIEGKLHEIKDLAKKIVDLSENQAEEVLNIATHNKE